MKFKFLLPIATFLLFLVLPQDAQAQRRCPTGQAYNNACQDCVPVPLPARGSSCPSPRGGEYNSCGQCACPSGQIECTGTCQESQQGVACTLADGRPGTLNACGTLCSASERPPVRLSPYSAASDDQARASIWINKTAAGNLIHLQSSGDDRLVVEPDGDLRVLGGIAGGDVYLNNGKAIRVDGAGVMNLNFGNWGAGADGLTLNVLGSLNVGTPAFPRDLTVHGNIVLAGLGATVDGVNLDGVLTAITAGDGIVISGTGRARKIAVSETVLTAPVAACGAGEALTWNGSALSCAAAGGAAYAAGANITIDSARVPNTIGVVSSPTLSGLTVRGNVDIRAGNFSFTGEDFEVAGEVTAGSLHAGGSIIGNFSATDGAACATDQILQRTAVGWRCAALPPAGIVAEADPIFSAWRGTDRGAQTLQSLTVDELRVLRTGRFVHDIFAGRDVFVSGNIYTDSGQSILVRNPPDGGERYLTVESTNEGSGYLHFRVAVPTDRQLAEILLRQGDTDRWSLSTRPGSSNFEIWRNNGGWNQALQIGYDNGRVVVPNGLTVNEITSLTGTLGIASNLNVTGTAVSSFSQPVRVGGPSLDLDSADTGDILIEGRALFSGLHPTGDYLLHLSTYTNPVTRIPRFSVDRDGNGIFAGNITGASAVISGASTTNTLTVTGDARIDGTLNAPFMRVRETLTIRGLLSANAGANVARDLDVGGIIRAGSQDLPITSLGGGLKLADIANEDFDSAGEGSMIFGADNGERCTQVCSAHGLSCRFAYWANGNGATTCTNEGVSFTQPASALRRICFCGG